ncbi:MAG: transcription antitermination factor NusB [Deltaproteobacteria bacterium]|nr:transcription antitermination factor NusB [Candidatus Zymogenaceae bacterium]
MGKRRKARELVLQFLYQTDMNPPQGRPDRLIRRTGGRATEGVGTPGESETTIEEEIASFWENFKTEEEGKSFFRQLAGGVMAHRDEIDTLIDTASENWRIARMAMVDRNILRFSVYELMYLDDIPSRVTINEAVEIAKRYGSNESPSFINGILDKIAHTHTK